ncbi:hypothetical protein [Pseudomonas sp. Y3 TE3536]
MSKSLRFSHKILLAASLIVILAFSLFTLYNDYLQRNAIREDLENYLTEMGESTSTNIRNLFEGRIKLVENLAQNIAQAPSDAETPDGAECADHKLPHGVPGQGRWRFQRAPGRQDA